jgi:hypothetical protein
LPKVVSKSENSIANTLQSRYEYLQSRIKTVGKTRIKKPLEANAEEML